MLKEKIGSILASFKDGEISQTEAEERFEKLISAAEGRWPNDEKLRIAAFIGTELLDAQEPEAQKVEVIYTGNARDVESSISISCSVIEGNAHAGYSIFCDAIEGDAHAGNTITCDSISGDVTAGNVINCGTIDGDATAGNVINCGTIDGDARAGNSINYT